MAQLGIKERLLNVIEKYKQEHLLVQLVNCLSSFKPRQLIEYLEYSRNEVASVPKPFFVLTASNIEDAVIDFLVKEGINVNDEGIEVVCLGVHDLLVAISKGTYDTNRMGVPFVVYLTVAHTRDTNKKFKPKRKNLVLDNLNRQLDVRTSQEFTLLGNDKLNKLIASLTNGKSLRVSDSMRKDKNLRTGKYMRNIASYKIDSNKLLAYIFRLDNKKPSEIVFVNANAFQRNRKSPYYTKTSSENYDGFHLLVQLVPKNEGKRYKHIKHALKDLL